MPLGRDGCIELRAGLSNRYQSEVVIGVDLDVKVTTDWQVAAFGYVRKGASKFAELQGLTNDLAVSRRGVDRALVAVVQLCVEKGGGLAFGPMVGDCIVGNGGWDP